MKKVVSSAVAEARAVSVGDGFASAIKANAGVVEGCDSIMLWSKPGAPLSLRIERDGTVVTIVGSEMSVATKSI
jgi:hypothetical protein